MTDLVFVLASGNQHKAAEIAAMLPVSISLVLQSKWDIESPPEPASTFVENALIKARHACSITGLPTIADDSGLCVNALDGAPGIISARYAGESASDEDNRAKLLEALSGINEREASFYCALVCLNHINDPAPLIAVGRWEGSITEASAGDSGFGYDPVFYVPTHRKTAAELKADEKNMISHRGVALKTLVQQIRARYTA